MLPCSLSGVFSTLTRWFPNGALKQEFCGIEVTTFFGSNNFRHIEAIKVILFSKYSRIYVDLENAIKVCENVDGYGHNSVRSWAVHFCQLWQECMWTAVNVLKSCPKISDRTKRHPKQLNFFDINIKLAYKCRRAALSSDFNTLRRWFPNGVLNQEL